MELINGKKTATKPLSLINYSDDSSEENDSIDFKKFADFDKIKNLEKPPGILSDETPKPPGISSINKLPKKHPLPPSHPPSPAKSPEKPKNAEKTEKPKNAEKTEKPQASASADEETSGSEYSSGSSEYDKRKIKKGVKRLSERLRRDFRRNRQGRFETLCALFEARRSDWKQGEISSDYFLKRLKRIRKRYEEAFDAEKKAEWDIGWARVAVGGKAHFYALGDRAPKMDAKWVDRTVVLVKGEDAGVVAELAEGSEGGGGKRLGAGEYKTLRFSDEKSCQAALEKAGFFLQHDIPLNLLTKWHPHKTRPSLFFRFMNYKDEQN